ncbi:MAG: signal peptide peptidase SppA, partial [Gammaproteobacteria bacterium]|nr:signal peptide peptidase SppA [Gammaproteobacteria bacterium]
MLGGDEDEDAPMIRFFKAIWRILTGISRAISVLVPLLFVAIFLVFFSIGMQESAPEPLPEKAALLIAPAGPLVEDSPPVDPVAAFLNQEFEQPTLLQDVIRAVSWAATDDRITSLVLNLENLAGPTTSQVIELSEAINAFKAADKPVIAVGDFYSQAHYLLAAQADHILLHPEGGIFLEGFSVYRSYLRTFLENIRVTMHVFKAGEHKSAVEPYLRDDMSDGEREIVTRWLNGLWSAYSEMAESGRGLPAGSLDAFIEDFPARLASADNDMAETMIAGGWIDTLAGHAERDAALAEWVGVTDEEGQAEMVDLVPYLEDVKTQQQAADEGLPLIAVVP